MNCVFCNTYVLKDRIFYDNLGWAAFLAAPAVVKGHAILLKRRTDSWSHPLFPLDKMDGMDNALFEVSSLLMRHYKPKDILFASLRGDVKHFHIHIYPLWEKDEKEWRETTLITESGFYLNLLGYLEVKSEEEALIQRLTNGWAIEEQREELTKLLTEDVNALRLLNSKERPWSYI